MWQWEGTISRVLFESVPFLLRDHKGCTHCTYVLRYKVLQGRLYALSKRRCVAMVHSTCPGLPSIAWVGLMLGGACGACNQEELRALVPCVSSIRRAGIRPHVKCAAFYFLIESLTAPLSPECL